MKFVECTFNDAREKYVICHCCVCIFYSVCRLIYTPFFVAVSSIEYINGLINIFFYFHFAIFLFALTLYLAILLIQYYSSN